MRGGGCRRPRLCLLCECPTVDGGVYVPPRKPDRLSRWWKAHFDIDFEHKSRTVCHFCAWDLRYADQNSKEKEPSDQKWWPKFGPKNRLCDKYMKYYEEGLMKPCFVKIYQHKKAEKLVQDYRNRESGPGHQCFYCPQRYAGYRNLFRHAKRVHPEKIIICDKRGCGKFFHTQEEKVKHLKKEHMTKCVYCGKVSTNNASNYRHMQKNHKSQIIRCNYLNCIKYFKTTEERDKHFEDFHNSGNYFCCFCDKRFATSISQWSHMKKYHKEALKCDAIRGCPNYFKTEKERQKHVQENHSEGFKCLYCSETFTTKYITGHINTFHKDVALRCEFQCAIWFNREQDRQEHYNEKHEGKFSCPFSPKKKFQTLGQLQSHLCLYHKKEKIKCPYKRCSNYFKSEEDKAKHIKEVHDIYDEKFRCVYCDKFFLTCMYQHVFKLHKDVAIKCNFKVNCPTYFKTLEDRDKHIREVHQVEKVRKPVHCLYCDTIVAAKHILRPHVQLKHADIAIKCKHHHCGTYFKSKQDLEAHFSLKPKHRQLVKMVDPRIKLTCAHCPSSYKCKSQLSHHIMLKHLGQKDVCPHCKMPSASKRDHVISTFCKLCNQKFQCLGLLRNHAKKCRPVFQCLICSKSFKMKSLLTYHSKRTHKWKRLYNKSKGFKCDQCLIYFSSKYALQTHNRFLHESPIVATCDFCKKQYPTLLSVQQHIEQNHLRGPKKRLFPCPFCNRKLRTESELRKHTLSKCNKKVQCHICGKLLKPECLKSHLRLIH